MDLGLATRACIVSGGSRGIGLEVAKQVNAEGADLLLLGRDTEALSNAATECNQAAHVETLALDITEPDAGDEAVKACLGRFGRLDALVNNAGTMQVRPIEQLTDDDWQAQWDLHVMAPMRLMRAAIPEMVKRGWGRVVNVGSSSGKRPSQRNVAYSVTKAAEQSLSRSYADAYARQGVLVNCITPGPTAGDLWLEPGGLADQAAELSGQSRERVLESLAAGLPIARLGRPEEIAAVIVFLCSEPASNVSGATWSVDGGAVPVII